jgi:MutS domain V
VPDPHAEYTKRIENYQRISSGREKVHRRIGNLKLGVVIAGSMLAWLLLGKHLVSAYWLFLPVAAYACLAIWHEFVLRSKARAETASAFHQRGLARLEDRWAGTGETGERFRDAKHVYADDLDLFGRGSLFELLSTARLPMGEAVLAHWLCFPSPQASLLDRQKLVAELRDNLELRESLALIGAELRARLNPESLAQWAEGRDAMRPSALRSIIAVTSGLAVLALMLSLATLRFWPLLAVLIVEGLIFGWLHSRAAAAVSGVSANAEGLILFSRVLERITQERCSSQRLQEFLQELKSDNETAAHALRKLARIVYWIEARDSVIGRFLDVTMLYTIQTAYAAEAWRRRWGGRMRAWINIVGEIEALLSLAAYSFEHPQDPFPEFIDAQDSHPLYAGVELGHPLIAAAQCVSNSIRLDEGSRLLLVSGSNMSGKSTFLRTVGINVVLANAGAPIRGKALRLSPLALGTRIRSSDSLQEGRSNFYTEILRIRQVFETIGTGPPLLFLFDELLEGTNSKDRRIGADGLLRALIHQGAIGIVTTHDLALTEITHSLGDIANNAHFQDFVENDQMRFDYKLQEGVVAKSNALELMRLIGLKV